MEKRKNPRAPFTSSYWRWALEGESTLPTPFQHAMVIESWQIPHRLQLAWATELSNGSVGIEAWSKRSCVLINLRIALPSFPRHEQVSTCFCVDRRAPLRYPCPAICRNPEWQLSQSVGEEGTFHVSRRIRNGDVPLVLSLGRTPFSVVS